MPDLRAQKTIASRILKCGETRVWLDPARAADIAEAITAGDVRKLISDGIIKEKPKTGQSNFRANYIRAQKKKGRRKGKGSRKGRIGARLEKKRTWMNRIRSIRRLIREMKEKKTIDNRAYRDVYVKSKSGFFRSRSHVMIYLERNNLIRKEEDKK